jgi:hypothetical protein
MRKITDHRINGLNEHIEIMAIDPPSQGGASHVYELRLSTKLGVQIKELGFQEGPIGGPADVNGISNEALLAIVIDRIRGFQGELANKTGVAGGQFKCRENALALTKLEEALMWLQKRTLDRVSRGVEGKLAP